MTEYHIGQLLGLLTDVYAAAKARHSNYQLVSKFDVKKRSSSPKCLLINIEGTTRVGKARKKGKKVPRVSSEKPTRKCTHV